MKRLKQINESKETLLQSLMDLLEKKPIDTITVTEIARNANISRMTFYRHFDEKEDVLMYYFIKSIDMAIDKINNKDNITILDILLCRFEIIANSPYTNILVRRNGFEKLAKSFSNRFKYRFKHMLPSHISLYQEAFISGGVDAFTAKWIESGMKENFEDISMLCFDFIASILKNSNSDYDNTDDFFIEW